MRRFTLAFASLGAKAALTLFGLLLVTFLIARVVPIDPVLAVVGDRASTEPYQRVRQEMGLDRPVAVQFARYVAMLAQGRLGNSALTREPVSEDIARFFPATMELATVATLIGLVLGVPAGVWAAARHNRFPDHALRVVGLFGYSVPVFWLGLMALLLGGVGVASAVSVFAREKLPIAAVLRCLGAPQRTVFGIYLLQAAVMGFAGAAVGVALGVLVQWQLPRLLADFLPIAVAAGVDWRSVVAGLGIGVWVAVVFALLLVFGAGELLAGLAAAQLGGEDFLKGLGKIRKKFVLILDLDRALSATDLLSVATAQNVVLNPDGIGAQPAPAAN